MPSFTTIAQIGTMILILFFLVYLYRKMSELMMIVGAVEQTQKGMFDELMRHQKMLLRGGEQRNVEPAPQKRSSANRLERTAEMQRDLVTRAEIPKETEPAIDPYSIETIDQMVEKELASLAADGEKKRSQDMTADS